MTALLACANVVFRSEPRLVHEGDLRAFALAFDPQPAHLDARAADATPLRGLAASGWHTCALIADHIASALEQEKDYRGMDSVDELRWFRPVRAGDQLSTEMRWLSSAPCHCQRSMHRRSSLVEARNQCGELVVRWKCQTVFGPATQSGVCDHHCARAARVTGHPGNHFIKYHEDVCCGDQATLGGYTFDLPQVALFERIVAGHQPRFGKRHVDGWNVVAAWMRLIVEYYERQASRLAATEQPIPLLGPATGVRWLRWLSPVAIGERLTFRSWIERKIEVASNGPWGLVVAGTEGHNARGELVVSFYPQFLLQRYSLPTQLGKRT